MLFNRKFKIRSNNRSILNQFKLKFKKKFLPRARTLQDQRASITTENFMGTTRTPAFPLTEDSRIRPKKSNVSKIHRISSEWINFLRWTQNWFRFHWLFTCCNPSRHSTSSSGAIGDSTATIQQLLYLPFRWRSVTIQHTTYSCRTQIKQGVRYGNGEIKSIL